MTGMVNGGCTCSFRVGMTIQSCWGETPQGTNLGEKNQFGPLLFFFFVYFSSRLLTLFPVLRKLQYPFEHFADK
jgi:hypothetical protein